jgi:hypothetical protein
MVLYHCGLPTYLAAHIKHRWTVNKDKEAVILVNKTQMENHLIDIKKFEMLGIFNRVINCDPFAGRAKKTVGEQAMEDAIVAQYDTVLAKAGIDVGVLEGIFISNDCWEGEFNIYCTIKGLKYFLVEIAPNSLYNSSDGAYPVLERMAGAVYAKLYRKYSATTAVAQNAIPIVLSTSNKSLEFFSYKSPIIWDAKSIEDDISASVTKKIAKAYNFNFAYKRKSNMGVLFVLNSYGMLSSAIVNNSAIREYYSHIKNQSSVYKDICLYMCQSVLDYYVAFDSTVYIKTHPNDPLPQNETKRIFGEKAENLGEMPLDFYPLLDEAKEYNFSSSLSFASSANAFISSICSENICLTSDFFYTFYLYNYLYSALTFAVNNLGTNLKYQCPKILQVQCNNILKYVLNSDKVCDISGGPVPLEPNTITILNKSERENYYRWMTVLKNAPDSAVVCFPDILNDFVFYADDISEYFVPVRIRKIKIKADTLDNLCDEILYIFCKDIKVREKIMSFALEKELPRIGIKLMVSELTMQESRDIRVKAVTQNREGKADIFADNQVYALISVFNVFPAQMKKICLHDNIAAAQADKQGDFLTEVKEFCASTFPEAKPEFLDNFIGGEYVLQIIDANVKTKWNYGSPAEHLPFLTPIIHQYHQNSVTCMINYNLAWWSNSPLNNTAANNFGFLVTAKKAKVKDEILADLKDEHILVWCKDAALRSGIMAHISKLTKDLPNTGINLTYEVKALADLQDKLNLQTLLNKVDKLNWQNKSLRKTQNELSYLCDLYGSDKGSLFGGKIYYPWTAHTYTAVYEYLFSAIRQSAQSVFECGLGTNNPGLQSSMGIKGQPGASLKVWRDYFPKAVIIGADIDKNILFDEERIHTGFIDQTSPETIDVFFNSLAPNYPNQFDIMIDDGLHTFEAAICLFENAISHLQDNGIYIIEDIKWNDINQFKEYFNSYQNDNNFIVNYMLMSDSGDDNNLIIITKFCVRGNRRRR